MRALLCAVACAAPDKAKQPIGYRRRGHACSKAAVRLPVTIAVPSKVGTLGHEDHVVHILADTDVPPGTLLCLKQKGME
eukprot:518096-Amphidinium_carterae.1